MAVVTTAMKAALYSDSSKASCSTSVSPNAPPDCDKIPSTWGNSMASSPEMVNDRGQVRYDEMTREKMITDREGYEPKPTFCDDALGKLKPRKHFLESMYPPSRNAERQPLVHNAPQPDCITQQYPPYFNDYPPPSGNSNGVVLDDPFHTRSYSTSPNASYTSGQEVMHHNSYKHGHKDFKPSMDYACKCFLIICF